MDPFSPPVATAVNFLASLYAHGASYSTLCLARSALSCCFTFEDKTFGNLSVVKRFMKGVFEARPQYPKSSKLSTWDPRQVLNFLDTWVPNSALTLKELSYKLVMLLALLTGQRCQTIHTLSVDNLTFTDKKCVFILDSLLKHSRKGKHQRPIELLCFTPNENICVLEVLKEYITRTSHLREINKTTKLLLSFHRPHKPISKDTVSRWIKAVLTLSGIDSAFFTAHSTRAASTSAAVKLGVPMSSILSAAGWSREDTFAQFYKKDTQDNFGQALLSAYWPPK